MLRTIGLVTSLVFLLVACGGGGSGPASTVTPPPPATYTIGGTVTGLAGSGLVLVLNSNFGGDLPVSASGSFTFSTRLPDGSTFSVGVKIQPTSSPAQYCQVANSDGAIVAANVTDVTVTCGAGYTVGGTVSGLVGSGLTLATCHSVSLRGFYGERCNSPRQVGANGAFTLDSVYPAGYSGPDYVVTTQQPSSPTQHCVIGNAAVSIQNANDTSVTVSCAGFSYVTNAADNTLSAYSIDATTGALAVIGAPTTTGAFPHAAVGLEYYFGQDKRYVFVGNEGSNDVSAFAVNSTTGALTAVPGSPFPAGTDPQAMLFAGSYLYVANAGTDSVSAYTIDPSTGALAPLSSGPSTIATGKTPTSIVTFNGNVFVANHGGSNDISVFSIDNNITGTGVLTPVAGSPFLAGGNPLSLAVGGVGTGDRFLYTANPDATHPSISGFRIDLAGPLTRLSGSPFPLPVSHYIATDQTGAYLYVTSGANVVGYSIDATTGALTPLPGFPVSAGANAYSITVDPTNQFLYVTNDGAANVSAFTLDASTGALTPMSGSPFPAGSHPEFIATF